MIPDFSFTGWNVVAFLVGLIGTYVIGLSYLIWRDKKRLKNGL